MTIAWLCMRYELSRMHLQKHGRPSRSNPVRVCHLAKPHTPEGLHDDCCLAGRELLGASIHQPAIPVSLLSERSPKHHPHLNDTSLTSCDCSDALLKLKFPNGGFLSGPTMWSPKRQEGDTKIIGRAYTVKYAKNEDREPKMAHHYASFSIASLAGKEHLKG